MARQTNAPRAAKHERIAAQLEREREGDIFMRRQVEIACRLLSWTVMLEVDRDEAGVRVHIRGPGVEDLGMTSGAAFRLDAAPEETLEAIASIGEALVAAAHRARRYGLTAPWREDGAD